MTKTTIDEVIDKISSDLRCGYDSLDNLIERTVPFLTDNGVSLMIAVIPKPGGRLQYRAYCVWDNGYKKRIKTGVCLPQNLCDRLRVGAAHCINWARFLIDGKIVKNRPSDFEV